MALCGARLFVDPLPPGEVFGGGLFCGLPGADETHLVAGQVEGRGEVGGGGRAGAERRSVMAPLSAHLAPSLWRSQSDRDSRHQARKQSTTEWRTLDDE